MDRTNEKGSTKTNKGIQGTQPDPNGNHIRFRYGQTRLYDGRTEVRIKKQIKY